MYVQNHNCQSNNRFSLCTITYLNIGDVKIKKIILAVNFNYQKNKLFYRCLATTGVAELQDCQTSFCTLMHLFIFTENQMIMSRQNLPVILSALLVVVLMTAYFLKDNLNDFISYKMHESAGFETRRSGQQWVDSLYNYSKNKEDFEFTLIQFKSTGCTLCKQMEPELESLKRDSYNKVNVVVMNVLNPNSQQVMKHFGIAAVPTHVILNKEGKEIFRKYGYVPAAELKMQLVR